MTNTKPKFLFISAEDETVDAEYELRHDGKHTGISIQVCEDGRFTVNRYEFDKDGNAVSVRFIHSDVRTLGRAKKLALAAHAKA
jgi:hypothetical protein